MTEDNHRKALLTEAESLVNGDRNNTYGEPHQDFQRTADMLSALGFQHAHPGGVRAIAAHDVAVILAAVKLSRLTWSPEKRDSWVDLAGYAACGHEAFELTHPKPEEPKPEPEAPAPPDETAGFTAVRSAYGRRITALLGRDGKRVRYFRSPMGNFYRLADSEFTLIRKGFERKRARSGYGGIWDNFEIPVSEVPVWAR
ncbi:DUF6378 domain-containing protein [Amycolatopsis orientalis]|uniref:DUF6378 domain-containing protein n=1 Tax=Amycolatopsis orientalis TaxID=31958 RepID=UPI0003A892C5|nr:DUF6378 domain-containing protein [Amycolatopsis orientalis]